MGHNIDFTELLGLPEKVKCPRCKQIVDSMLDDYDIECGEPPKAKIILGAPARISFFLYCNECDLTFSGIVPIGKMRIQKED